MAPDAVVEISGLVKDYDGVEAVRGIDIVIRHGEVFGFLGPNGAGKTTTIRCLMGLLRPTRGTVRAFGLDVIRQGTAARRRMSYVPGELRLPERMTGLDLVDSIGRMRGTSDHGRRDELAERLRVDLHRPMRGLSSGNRRKVAVLLAFMAESELLVLDEPTSGLDPLMQHEFLALVREAKAAGRTVFLSSHVMGEVQRAADRVAVLRAGHVVASGTVAELRGQARQRVEVWFRHLPPAARLRDLPGIEAPIFDDLRFAATLSGPIGPLLTLLAESEVDSMLVAEPDLEDAFLDLYGDAQ